MNREVRIAALLSVLLFVPVFAGQGGGTEQQPMQMPGMQMPGMNHGMQMNEAGMCLVNMATGTSKNPLSWPPPMLPAHVGTLNLMLMGQDIPGDTRQAMPTAGCQSSSRKVF